ncbi:MAG: glycosyltransferase [Candidatus Daviesbacteria bacterium]|nr:glycosyltransferase [Candidatus Daviesbacteria bacterium]
MKDLSILIPARNEMFLARTIEDILANIEADTEVIAVLDGTWVDPPIPQQERVNLVYLPESIGQRAATNLACKLSKAKYVMKLDAHCSFDKGFDRKMIEAFKLAGDNVTMVPTMRNLWAFDWKCFHCGWKKYQGPTPQKCEQCGKTDKIRRKMIWVGKERPQSNSYCFDIEPHFQYFNDYTKRPEYKKDLEDSGLTETMSIQGSCFMMTRDKYWELNICDENFGSWGSQGIEVATKTWLSGGKVLANHKTWYAHMFRTQGGDFGFPYPISGKDQEKTKSYAKDLFFTNKWDKQVQPLSWLVEKFWPVKGWTEEDLAKLKTNKFEFKGSSIAVNPTESEPTEEPENIVDPAQIELPTEPPQTTTVYLADMPTARKRGRPKKEFGNVTIIGYGWVGKSVHNLFPDAYIYDPPIGDKQRANQGEIAFICVPTPNIGDGRLDTGIVEQCVAWCQCPLIVIRSTVNPGTCDYLSKKYHKRIIMQPEYLGETPEHPLLDEKSTPFLIIGGEHKDRRILINLYTKVYNANIKIRQVTAYEAEVIKLSENRAISFKVAECQELYDVCEKAGIDYYVIRDAVYGDDPRFNLWWTFVFPDKRGFKSKCIPKDVYAWCAWAESLGYKPEITRNLLEVNKKWLAPPQLKSVSSQDPLNSELVRKQDPLITDHEIPETEEDQRINQETQDLTLKT